MLFVLSSLYHKLRSRIGGSLRFIGSGAAFGHGNFFSVKNHAVQNSAVCFSVPADGILCVRYGPAESMNLCIISSFCGGSSLPCIIFAAVNVHIKL